MRFYLYLPMGVLTALGLLTTTVCGQPSPAAPTVPAAESEAAESEDGDSEEAKGEVLTIGSVAPELAIAKWMKGNQIDDFASDKVYVVEFWATWCPPCRASMPHLSQLQTQYGDKVTFIGISDEDEATVGEFFGQAAPGEEGAAEETAEGESESEAETAASDDDAAETTPPAKTWNDIITYTIALDKEQGTSKAYMEAAGQSGIPTSFIVGKDGMIEWIGHPMEMDDPLSQVVAGTWDREAARAEMIEAQKAEKALMDAFTKIREKLTAKDYDGALAIMDQLIADFPDNPQFPMMRLQLVRMSGDSTKLAAELDKIAQSKWDDPEALNELAWGIAGETEKPDQALLALAQKIAERANEVTNGTDGSILDTLARVHYAKGDLDAAIEWQKKAVAAGGPMVDDIKATLETYEKEKAEGGKPSEEAAE